MPSGHFAIWRMLSALGASAAIAGASLANPIPEDQRWATIGSPGNEPYTFTNGDVPFSFGAVDHEYRISRTETTAGEWLEFVRAYAPHIDPIRAGSSLFLSHSIARLGPNNYVLVSPAEENRPVDIGWRFAARYCNWLHNDKRLDRAAFDTGAYDATTFGDTPLVWPDGGQIAHSPGAKYWIPTQDEWVKAAHFDPNKGGPGVPGYWLFPTTSDTQPVYGFPNSGGESSAFTGGYGPVASYPGVQSPWGLWDVSGGLPEWTETPAWYEPDIGAVRTVEGSGPFPVWYPFEVSDQVDFFEPSHHVDSLDIGFRIARAVPGVSSAGLFFCAFTALNRRRKPVHEAHPDDRVRTPGERR